MNKLINWLKESNRLKHLKVCVIMFIGLFMIQYVGITILYDLTSNNPDLVYGQVTDE